MIMTDHLQTKVDLYIEIVACFDAKVNHVFTDSPSALSIRISNVHFLHILFFNQLSFIKSILYVLILQTCPAGIKVQNLIRLSFIIFNNYELVFLIIEAYSNDTATAFKYFLRPKEV